jgi:hypothetical protein
LKRFIYQFTIGATGVEKSEDSTTTGWCRDYHGAPHAVAMTGRTFHFMPTARPGVGPSGGLSYFVFDSRAALASHAASRNTPQTSKVDTISTDIVTALYNEMLEHNPICTTLHDFGTQEHFQRLIQGSDATQAAIATVSGNIK